MAALQGKEGKVRGLYVHVPYCRRKCPYCHFYSLVGRNDEAGRYFALLRRELEERTAGTDPFASVYFGGGTPSLAPPAEIDDFLRSVERRCGLTSDAEITLEANPEGLTLTRLRSLRRTGVNRLSIGCQSFSEAELAALGRRHGPREALQAVETARRAGFDNVNIDLMGGVPGTRVKDLEANLVRAVRLAPAHVSVYLLDGNEDAAFLAGAGWGEKEEVAALELVEGTLGAAGYEHYETSNYAQAGRECRHNLVYWRGEEYLGLGPAACSYAHGVRGRNRADLDAYLRGAFGREEERIDAAMLRRERIMLGLRLREGVSLAAIGAAGLRGRLAEFEALGLVRVDGDHLTLTAAGRPLADRLAVELF